MELKNQTDHIALLSLMMVGVLTKRLNDIGQLDHETAAHLHRLVQGVSVHASHAGIRDLKMLLDNIDKSLAAAQAANFVV
jgi:hypothetical protein